MAEKGRKGKGVRWGRGREGWGRKGGEMKISKKMGFQGHKDTETEVGKRVQN